MLKSVETSETERPDPLTKFKLFEHENVTGPSDCQGLQLPALAERNKLTTTP